MIVYIHPKCTTCKKALKWFELNDVTFEQKDIRETPPTEIGRASCRERVCQYV